MKRIHVGHHPPLQSASSCRVIAEAGQCGGRSPSMYQSMADAAKSAGAWGFKVQLLTPDTIAHPTAPKYWADRIGTKTQADAFAAAGLVPYDQWHQVKAHCDDIGIVFLATPFDLLAVDVLEDMGVDLYKIASGDITYRPLIERIAATGKPVLLSTGASTRQEVLDAFQWGRWDDRCIPLACTLSYPTPPHAAHLARIFTLADEYPLVGYSDHTTIPETALAAAAMGACVLERHFTTHEAIRANPNVPDHAMAIMPGSLREYVRLADLGAKLRGVEDLGPTLHERAAHADARRSIYAAHDIPADTPLTADDFVYLRPGRHTPPSRYKDLVGRRLPTAKAKGDPLP